jgi:alkylhydroperoxidase family enzyme
MAADPVTGFEPVDLSTVDEGVATILDEARRDMGAPEVPDSLRLLAVSPGSLRVFWGILQSLHANLTLPQSLMAMISYACAEHRNCRYCSASNELVCRNFGIDERTLERLASDPSGISPARVQAIITFALKVALDPQGLVLEDYDAVRRQGVSDEELVEVAMYASMTTFFDTFADALKLPVEPEVQEALERFRGAA